MGKVAPDSTLDALLDEIATATVMFLCTAEPTSHANADALSLIVGHTLTGGDFTNANGDTNGRKVTVAAQNGLTADASGTASHVCITDGVNIVYITTCDNQSVTDTNTVNIGAWDVEVADPT